MFTGIVTAIGTIREARHTTIPGAGDLHATIACPFDPATIAIGASIACSGVCLTVVDRGGTAGDAWFAVDISGETLARSVPGRWSVGSALNLEPALKLGDELGGHIVTGHVDGVGQVVGLCPAGESTRLGISTPRELAPYIAAKGSITVDGSPVASAPAEYSSVLRDPGMGLVLAGGMELILGELKLAAEAGRDWLSGSLYGTIGLRFGM